ncbi:LPS assembly lipoprotein LptE [Rubritalea profundi]|uniref:Penicillin-binding protein activator LpoB n=1 Tax=Rubritalea profundi TaxID=1658618 RepID=A0A2S7U4Q5_9BACT|nr:LPS assembly lipoprotein LptE [Rubritalea profundi]PQJ29497.1 hypothetical protein BSZ32_14015 [Rubritalea profundi]
MLRQLLAAALCLTALTSCAGYQLGNVKPSELSSVNSISVPLFKNETQEQRLASLVTNSMVDAITRDGTYNIASAATSDADLIATIKTIEYSERRNARFDSLKATEMYMNLKVEWKLVDHQNQTLASGKVSGRTQFSVDSNQQTSRTNAFPDAAKNATELIMLRIANGF